MTEVEVLMAIMTLINNNEGGDYSSPFFISFNF